MKLMFSAADDRRISARGSCMDGMDRCVCVCLVGNMGDCGKCHRCYDYHFYYDMLCHLYGDIYVLHLLGKESLFCLNYLAPSKVWGRKVDSRKKPSYP